MRQQQGFGRKSPWDLQLGLWYWCWMLGGQLTVKQGYHSVSRSRVSVLVKFLKHKSLNLGRVRIYISFSMIFRLKRNPTILFFFFFLRFYSAFKDNFSDHNNNICSLSKLKYAQKSNSCFYHPNIIPYWGLTYVLLFFACIYLIWY